MSLVNTHSTPSFFLSFLIPTHFIVSIFFFWTTDSIRLRSRRLGLGDKGHGERSWCEIGREIIWIGYQRQQRYLVSCHESRWLRRSHHQTTGGREQSTETRTPEQNSATPRICRKLLIFLFISIFFKKINFIINLCVVFLLFISAPNLFIFVYLYEIRKWKVVIRILLLTNLPIPILMAIWIALLLLLLTIT